MSTVNESNSAEQDRQADWYRLLARVVHDVIQGELHLFEEHLEESLKTAADWSVARLMLITSVIVGAICFVAALILLLAERLPLWLSFAIAGASIIVLGRVVNSRTKPAGHRRRSTSTEDRADAPSAVELRLP